jgi:DNA-binding transcriptional MerR regulator
MPPHEPIRKRPTGPGPTREIPDKLYFRIGEVAKLCEVPAYVLRFWEGEFPQLKPNKGGTGQRLYRRRDVEMALRIKTLLYDEGYTIPGARQAFKAELRSSKEPQASGDGAPGETVDAKHLQTIQKELREIHSLLSKPAASRQAVQAIRTSRAAKTAEPIAQPAPMQFPKPKLLQTAKPKETKADSFVNSLFGDLPPLE